MFTACVCRECGLQSSAASDDSDTCAVCLEKACTVAAEGLHCVCCVCVVGGLYRANFTALFFSFVTSLLDGLIIILIRSG